jgi:NitT/TauT family transport system substrate-binding protein
MSVYNYYRKLKSATVILGFLIGIFFGFGISLGADQKLPIRLAYLQNDIHQLACWVALEKGFYTQEGLEVTVAGIFKAGPELMSAFAAGALDMGYVGIAPATTAVANKAARVVVLAQANSEGSALVVRKESRAQAFSELKGNTLAVPGHATVQDFLLRKALVKNNLSDQQISIMVIKPPEMLGALRNGDIEGFIAWEPFPAKAVTLEVGKVLLPSRAIWPDHPCCVLAVEARFLESRPEEAKKMVRAHVRATDFINQHPQEILTIALKYTGMDEKTLVQALKNVKYSYSLNPEAEKEYVHFLSHWKFIKVEDISAFVGRFINLQILSEVLKK